jgi:hypothetical protein
MVITKQSFGFTSDIIGGLFHAPRLDTMLMFNVNHVGESMVIAKQSFGFTRDIIYGLFHAPRLETTLMFNVNHVCQFMSSTSNASFHAFNIKRRPFFAPWFCA